MEGLAQQMASQGASMGNMPTVEEIIQLLVEGMDPQQLLEMGVPEELLMQALQIIQQQTGGAGQGGEVGLAQSMVSQ